VPFYLNIVEIAITKHCFKHDCFHSLKRTVSFKMKYCCVNITLRKYKNIPFNTKMKRVSFKKIEFD